MLQTQTNVHREVLISTGQRYCTRCRAKVVLYKSSDCRANCEQGPDATNKEELVGDIKVGGSLGCCDHRIVEFRILKDGRKAKSRTTILDFRRADFNLFRDLLGRFPWFMALDRRGIQESWLLKSIPKSRKSSVGGRRSVWMCKQCWGAFRRKQVRWKQGEVTQEYCRDDVWTCRNEVSESWGLIESGERCAEQQERLLQA